MPLQGAAVSTVGQSLNAQRRGRRRRQAAGRGLQAAGYARACPAYHIPSLSCGVSPSWLGYRVGLGSQVGGPGLCCGWALCGAQMEDWATGTRAVLFAPCKASLLRSHCLSTFCGANTLCDNFYGRFYFIQRGITTQPPAGCLPATAPVIITRGSSERPAIIWYQDAIRLSIILPKPL